VALRASPQSGADEALFPDKTIEDSKRFCPIQSDCGADVTGAAARDSG
jgi:hypothetical protein